jgi:hypothetical protein
LRPALTRADRGGAAYLDLQRLARAQGRPTAELIQLYVLEAFLRRLSRSAQVDRLVLKGGMLLAAFDLRRPTRDVDLLALACDNDPFAVRALVVEVGATPDDDGVLFDVDGAVTEVIRDEDLYPGVRVRLEASLATARVPLSVDVNVGDPVWPRPARTPIPSLLGGPPVHVLGYPLAMVVAEKLVTAIQRGRANTRWRDFADLWMLLGGPQAQQSGQTGPLGPGAEALDDTNVIEAIRAVAAHRAAALAPLGPTLAGMEREAQPRWSAWRKRQAGAALLPERLGALIAHIDARSGP